MNVIENEAVVARILKEYGDLVELVDVRDSGVYTDIFETFLTSPGMTQWEVLKSTRVQDVPYDSKLMEDVPLDQDKEIMQEIINQDQDQDQKRQVPHKRREKDSDYMVISFKQYTQIIKKEIENVHNIREAQYIKDFHFEE